MQHHIKEASRNHPSYLEDSPDFLRCIEELNEGPTLPDNTLLVTMDAIGLYDDISNEEGLDSLGEALEARINPKVPAKFIKRMVEIVLE